MTLRPFERELLRNVSVMSAVAWFVHAFVESPVHEYGHYWAAGLAGASAHIDGARTVWAAAEPLSPLAQSLVSLSGGLAAAGVVLVLFVLIRKPFGVGLLALAAADLAYAPLDGTEAGYLLGLVVFAAMWALVFGVYFAGVFGRRLPRGMAWLSVWMRRPREPPSWV